MSLRKDWLSRQFLRVDADVQNWPISMKVEAGFANREQARQALPDEKNAAVQTAPALETAPNGPARKTE